jgi:hypothetical protein
MLLSELIFYHLIGLLILMIVATCYGSFLKKVLSEILLNKLFISFDYLTSFVYQSDYQ